MSIVFTGPSGMYEPITSMGMYSDSTPMVKTAGWDRIVRKSDTLIITGGSMAQFITAMLLVDAIDMARYKLGLLVRSMRLVLPYIPGARQDRSNPTGDVLFTLVSVGQMINDRRFSSVTCLDPHSPVAFDAIGLLTEFPLSEVAKMLPVEYDGVIAADKGGKDRAEQFGKTMNLPVFYGTKTRDVSTGKLTGFTLDNLGAPGHYLVVDDICDGGGTFNGLAEKINEQGSTANLYVSHGIFSKGTSKLKENFNMIYSTDSLPSVHEHFDVTVLPVVKNMVTA